MFESQDLGLMRSPIASPAIDLGPWSDHLDGPIWELRIRLRGVAARITYWCTAEGTIVLLTVFRKTRQHDQRQIDRAVRAQKACERDHRGPAVQTYERQV
jgi:hypothetical protein